MLVEFHPTTVISPGSMVQIYFGVWDSGLFIVSTSLFSRSEIPQSLNLEHLDFIQLSTLNPKILIRSNGCREFGHSGSLALGLAYPILPLSCPFRDFVFGSRCSILKGFHLSNFLPEIGSPARLQRRYLF
jgi:hypothetical protein